MDINSKDRNSLIFILSVLIITLICGLSTFSTTPKSFFSFLSSNHSQSYNKSSNLTTQKDGLDEILAEASTPNRTVIIAVVNKAYVDGDKPMLDIFLDGFWMGEDTRDLINHLVLVTMDQTAFERCKFLRLHCYRLETDGVGFDTEKLYMSEDFIKMMWRRTRFLGDVLKRGYSFIFTDTDVLWLRNPFPKLSLNESIDVQFSTDNFNGNQWSAANPINTGFYLIRSNNKTISLFDQWYARKDSSTGMKEQDVLQGMIREGVLRELQVRAKFLDTLYFSGFCQNSKDIRDVTTVHSNCCRTIEAKIGDLTDVIHEWKKFKSLKSTNTSALWGMKHKHCDHSWKQLRG